MNVIITLLFVPVLGIKAHWKLEWNDEFDKDHLDHTNWEIYEGDSKTCDQWNVQRLNCYTNSSRNLRLTDGTLALTAIYEKHLNKKFTSASINTKKTFTSGRIDIRASLPVGKMLSSWVKLVPPELKNVDGVIKKQVNVFYNDQSNYIRYGLYLGKRIDGNIEDFSSNGNLNEFHTYSFEWNETDLIWKFDNIEATWLNLSKVNTFLMKPVILRFNLRVGGYPFFRNGALTLEDVIDWSCSQFILDYVRYYHWVDEDPGNSIHNELQSKSPVASCKVVMDEIRPTINSIQNKDSTTFISNNVTAIISIVCLLILLALIPLIIWLVIRKER